MFLWLTLVTLFEVWFLTTSKIYSTKIRTLNDEIKNKEIALSSVSDVLKIPFFNAELKIPYQQFLFFLSFMNIFLKKTKRCEPQQI